MERLYIITGSCGHLGGALVRQLSAQGAAVRGLRLPGEKGVAARSVTYVEGDVTDPASLRPLFQNLGDRPVDVIHAAGMVDITGADLPALSQVNVGGTANVVRMCEQAGVRRLLYVSSVHALSGCGSGKLIGEEQCFSPAAVDGGYARSKAAATQLVLDAAARGLDAVVVHPSGMLGPYDRCRNHLVQLVGDYLQNRLPACVRGGYDLVDVRDVAQGCLAALDKGVKGQCYILSGKYWEIRQVLNMVRDIAGGRKLVCLPLWLARAILPAVGLDARLRGRRPLYTGYSLRTLGCGDHFSHAKATWALGYTARELSVTLRDTVAWLESAAL